MSLADSIPMSWLPSLRLKTASRFSQDPFSFSAVTTFWRSSGFFQILTSRLDFPITSARVKLVSAVKPSLIFTSTPSCKRLIRVASGLVLKISSRFSLASRVSSFKRWLTMMMNPNVHSVLTISTSRYVAIWISEGVKRSPTTPAREASARRIKKLPLARNTTARKYANALTERVLCIKRPQAIKNEIVAIATAKIACRTTKSLLM